MATTTSTTKMIPTMQPTMIPIHWLSQVRLLELLSADFTEQREREREKEQKYIKWLTLHITLLLFLLLFPHMGLEFVLV